MDLSKCLLGCVCFILHGIVHVQGYGSNVDLKLDITEGLLGDSIDPNIYGDITVVEDTARESLDTIIWNILERFGAKVTATALTPSSTTTDDEACVFGVGFLSPLDSVTEKSFPSRKECKEGVKEAIIGIADEVLKYPRCIKYSEFEGLDFSEFIGEQEHERSTHCGRYRLVGMLDPLREVQDDPNFCNNYITFDINFNCSSETVLEPTCELNPGFTDGDDVMLLYKKHVQSRGEYGQQTRLRHATQMFRQREMSPGWNEEVEKEIDVAGKYGKMVMKIMKAFVQGPSQQNYIDECSNENYNAKDWVKSQLNEMQGLHSENTVGDTNDESVNSYKKLLQLIKTTVRNLKDESQLQNIADGLKSELQMFIDDSELRGVEAMRAAITEMINIVRESKQEYAKKRVVQEVCEMANNMDKMKQFLAEALQNPYHAAMGGKYGVFMNATSTLAVKLMFFYPEFYDMCYENILVHFHGALKPSNQQTNVTWMYDDDFLERLRDYKMNKSGYPFNKEIYEKLLQSCGKSTPCIQKMKGICRQANSPLSHSETVDSLRNEVCKMKLLKETVAKHTQHLMSNKMMQSASMQKDPFDAVCNGHDKMKMKKHVSLTRIDNGVIKRAHLDLENKMVAWQSVARCTCDYCGDRHGKDGSDSSRQETGDSSYDSEEAASEPRADRPSGTYPDDKNGGDGGHEDGYGYGDPEDQNQGEDSRNGDNQQPNYGYQDRANRDGYQKK